MASLASLPFVVQSIQTVASHLGNTLAVCKRRYVHPAIVQSYLRGALGRVGAHGDEAFVRALLTRESRLSEEQLLVQALRGSLRSSSSRRSSRP
jgi:DNA topoisomerase-1